MGMKKKPGSPHISSAAVTFSTQRCAEVLLDVARKHQEGETSLAEIRFVLFGEPTYRVFEMTYDAAKVAEQMEKMRRR